MCDIEGDKDQFHVICTICLHSLGNGGGLVVTSCGHAFHKACISDWFEKRFGRDDRTKCPKCDQVALRGDLKPLFVCLEQMDDSPLKLRNEELEKELVEIKSKMATLVAASTPQPVSIKRILLNKAKAPGKMDLDMAGRGRTSPVQTRSRTASTSAAMQTPKGKETLTGSLLPSTLKATAPRSQRKAAPKANIPLPTPIASGPAKSVGQPTTKTSKSSAAATKSGTPASKNTTTTAAKRK